eukprot:3507257-Rhodomonas_salina.1
MGHFTNRCPVFHDASTKVHDEAWHSVVQVVRPLLPPEAVVHFDVPMLDTKLQLAPAKRRDVCFGSSTFSGQAFRTWQPTELGVLLPDAVVVDAVQKRISLLEFTRPWSGQRAYRLHAYGVRVSGDADCAVYTKKILQLYRAWDQPTVRTPLEAGVRLSKVDLPEVADPVLHRRYRGITGHISFLVTMTCCDLAFAYAELS